MASRLALSECSYQDVGEFVNIFLETIEENMKNTPVKVDFSFPSFRLCPCVYRPPSVSTGVYK